MCKKAILLVSYVILLTGIVGSVFADPNATNPSPANGTTNVLLFPMVTLTWTPGAYVAPYVTGQAGNGHHVFFNTDLSSLYPATGSGTKYALGTRYGHYRSTTSSFDPSYCIIDSSNTYGQTRYGNPLPSDTTFYWSIMEVNNTATTKSYRGPVWSFTTISGKATNPTPASGTEVDAEHTMLNISLSWTAGIYAAGTSGHDVYFGTSSANVTNATTATTGIYKGRQTPTSYAANGLARGYTYYWRIDEVNGTAIWTGNVWSFTTSGVSGDFNGDGRENFIDFAIFANAWKSQQGQANWNADCDISKPEDSFIDWRDLGAFVEDWLVGVDQAGSPSPANAATGVSITATLSWTAGLGATSHDVYFGTASIPPFIGNQTATSYTPSTMANDTKYYWRIDEKNAEGTITGVVWSFTTIVAAPGQASSPNPPDAATGVFTTSTLLSWTAGSRATSHDVYFGTVSPGTFIGNQAGTTYNPGTMAVSTYYWRIDEKNAGGTTTGVVWSFTTVPSAPMSPGTNFWNIGWEGTTDFFAAGVNWATTTNPWNPTLISELQQAQIKCLRFMDWNATNNTCVQNWSQRIPKTANHYNSGNTIPCFVDNYVEGTGTYGHNLVWNGTTSYGVAYEWQIDLCNRVGADIWINIPITATADFEYQLASLLNSQLNSNLKIYIEFSNEVWNWGSPVGPYASQQADALGLTDIDVGAYCEPWWKYYIYGSVRAFEQFESVFGKNSPRLVKVIAGQVSYNWGGYDYNHMIVGHLAALANSTINPNGTTFNAYAMGPYMGGQTMADEHNSIAENVQYMQYARNSLTGTYGTGISLVCYESGADNYPDSGLTLTYDPLQEQAYIDYLNALAPLCNGVINQYCFYGGCWGLKNHAGQAASAVPKWRGWLDYWAP